jgi:hypothetical protein
MVRVKHEPRQRVEFRLCVPMEGLQGFNPTSQLATGA